MPPLLLKGLLLKGSLLALGEDIAGQVLGAIAGEGSNGPISIKTINLGDWSNVTGRFRTVHAIRLGIEPFAELGGQLGVIERIPSRFSLFLPSDPQIGPGNAATVSRFLYEARTLGMNPTVRDLARQEEPKSMPDSGSEVGIDGTGIDVRFCKLPC